jgi:DNA-directed RNA polymerase sigma subunit (sigma70/sigma32)
VVATHLAHLPQQERMVIARRLGLNANQKPLSYTAIAREMGLSLEKVRVIEMRALRRLRWLHDQSLAQGGDANGPGREG